jgi:hypothetical protein
VRASSHASPSTAELPPPPPASAVSYAS